MDGHPRQNPAYRPATERAPETGLSLCQRVALSSARAAQGENGEKRRRCFGTLTELAPRPTLRRVAPGVTVLGEAGRRRAGIAIVAIAVAVTAVVGLAIGLFFPATDESGRWTYAVVEPIRGFFRLWLVMAGVNLVVGLTTTALAGWLLVLSRGWIAATVGACLMWFGCALYAVGLGGVAAAYYFATEPAVLDAAASTRLLDHLHESTIALWGPAIAGALLVAAGQISLAVGLWRARTVPRWIPILAATIPLTFVFDTSGVRGLLVELPQALAGVGIAWYLWQRYVAQPRRVAASETALGAP